MTQGRSGHRSNPRHQAPFGLAVALAASLGIALTDLRAAPPGQGGQQTNPVYVDDSPAAADTFVRVREHVSGGNLDEAVRVLQVLLDDQPDRLVASAHDPELFVNVRGAVNELLLGSPKLLERYRAVFGPRAERQLGEGQTDLVSRSLMLTPMGLDATVRLAQSAIEEARFEHARMLLEELDRHPDRKGEGGRLASQLMTMLARLLDRSELREMATRWARDAGAGLPDLTPTTWPAAARSSAATPMLPVPATNTEGMVSKPLWTVPLNPSAGAPDANLNPGGGGGSGGGGGRGQPSVPVYARSLLLIPSVASDTVYVNDGAQIGAWDRFTLAPRWVVTPGVGDAPPPEQGIRGNRRRIDRFNGFGGYGERSDDLSTVAIWGRFVVGATGRTLGGMRGDGDDRIAALDAQTGRIRWMAQLNSINPLDPQSLYDATVRGPIQIVENTVVFAARKHLPDRRLVSVSLVGLDLNTGKLLWVRPIGSAGSMPWVQQSMGADGIAAANGIVYRADRLGVVGAVNAGSGRVCWVRRLSVDAATGSDSSLPWQTGIPVVDGASIILIAPDMKRLLRLDRATGAILSQRDLANFAPAHPRYLLRIGETLACVGDDRVAFIPTATFETDTPVVTPAVTVPGIRGRCVVSGDSLILPTTSGYSVVKPSKPDELTPFPLEESGNILPIESQLVVLDDSRMHSYLRWEVAEGLLTKRIEQDPKDPAPAVTYAELAYRADKPDKIVGAVRLAIKALKDGPQNDSTWNARARLIDALQGMLAAALEPAPASLPSSPAPSKGPLAVHPITDRALLEQLVTLLGEVSFQPEDKLAHTLALGRLSELNAKPEDAVVAYQKVLSEPALGGATWHGPQVSIRGELEATRRIEALLKQHGAAIYAAQETDAAARLAALGPTPTEQQLELLAARFPLSQQTPGVWSRIAELRTLDKKPQQASVALEAALRSATRQPDPPPAVVGEIAGQLIVGLRERQQLAAAAGVLRTVRTRFPGLALTASGQPLDSDKLGAELSQKIAASMRWPRIGPIRTDNNAQAIVGWTIMEPLLSDRTPSVTNLLPLASDDEISIWAAPTTDHADNHELLVKVWSLPTGETAKPYLIRTTPDAAYFAVVKDSDVVVTKVAGTPLETKWKSDPLGKVFGAADARAMRRPAGSVAGFLTPGEGETQPTNLIVAMDDRTIVLVQRAGKAAAFDTDSGELLWTARVGVGRVYDADLSAGTLAIGGDQETYGPGGVVTGLKPVVQIIDARTGRTAQRIGDLGGQVRWVGFSEAGSLIAALDNSVVCFDLGSAQPNWTIAHPDAMPVSSMWIFGDQLVMADQSRSLWLASISTGRLRPAALDVPRTHIDASQTMDAFPLAAVPGTGFGVATQQGLALFGPEGTLTGVDGMDGSASMIRPKPADGRALTIETIADGRSSDGMMMFTLHAMDVGGPTGAALLDSRPILLGARPSAMTLLDERVAVTAGNVTVILKAPVAPK